MSKLEHEKPSEDSCQSCRYYFEFEDPEPDDDSDIDNADDLTGTCRRYPPTVYPGLTPISVYPDVSAAGWCGEYMPK